MAGTLPQNAGSFIVGSLHLFLSSTHFSNFSLTHSFLPLSVVLPLARCHSLEVPKEQLIYEEVGPKRFVID